MTLKLSFRFESRFTNTQVEPRGESRGGEAGPVLPEERVLTHRPSVTIHSCSTCVAS